MKAVTWKVVFAAMSPSPVFEAVAEFAEVIVHMDSEQSRSRKQSTTTTLPGSLRKNGRSIVTKTAP